MTGFVGIGNYHWACSTAEGPWMCLDKEAKDIEINSIYKRTGTRWPVRRPVCWELGALSTMKEVRAAMDCWS